MDLKRFLARILRLKAEKPRSGQQTADFTENTQGQMKTLSLKKLEEPAVYSPAVEHPLFTIQDRITRIEELHKWISDRLVSIDEKVATKGDVEAIKALLSEDLLKGDRVLVGIDGLEERLKGLQDVKRHMTQQVDVTKRQLTQQLTQLDEIESGIKLLESHKRVLSLLSEQDLSTIELADKLKLTRQYLWARLKELKKAGYVKSQKIGRKTRYKLIKAADTE